jgi:hypothetical protein
MTTGDRRTLARQKAAERQRLAARKKRQQRVFAVLGVVVLGFSLLVTLRLAGVGEKKTTTQPGQLDAKVLSQVTGVPASAFEDVSAGSSKNTLVALPGPDLVKDGKPRVVYIGAEYCPYCAAQRWAVVVALSRFGTWKGLTASTSAVDDVFPGTATFSFHGSSFTSDYLMFEGVETETNEKGPDGRYTKLDTLTDEQATLFRTFDKPPYVPAQGAGAIPFLDLGNRFLISGSSFTPDVLSERTLSQIAKALSDPKSDVAKAVLGSANRITAAICALTNGQPGSVCSTAPIPELQRELPRG